MRGSSDELRGGQCPGRSPGRRVLGDRYQRELDARWRRRLWYAAGCASAPGERGAAAIPDRAAAITDRIAVAAVLPSARRSRRLCPNAPMPLPGGIGTGNHRCGLPASPQSRKSRKRPPATRRATTAATGIAPDPQAREAITLHRSGYWADNVSQKAKVIQTLLGDHQDSVVSRDHSQRAQPRATAGEDAFTGLLYQQGRRPGAAGSSLKPRCANSAREAVPQSTGLSPPARGRRWPVMDSVPRRLAKLTAARRRPSFHLDTPLPGASGGLPAGSGEAAASSAPARPHFRCGRAGAKAMPGATAPGSDQMVCRRATATARHTSNFHSNHGPPSVAQRDL